MKDLLKQIKDDVYNLHELVPDEFDMYGYIVDEIAKRYAIEVAKEALKNATLSFEYNECKDWYDSSKLSTKQSILSETNIPKLD